MRAADPPASPAADALEHLAGLIERVTFHSPDSGFAVIKARVRGRRDLVSLVGVVPQAAPGEFFDARGRWVMDKTYGPQFKADELRTAPPSTPEGIERYLASGTIKGIGPEFAARLVQAFGAEVFEVIEQAPQRLTEVPGIGQIRSQRLVAAWAEQKAVRRIMVFLHSHGVSTSRAFRIYKTYGEEAIERVQADPYQLARDVWGIGFKSADQIAERLGIDRHSPLRARAGVEYTLQQLTDEGHCAYRQDKLIERTIKLLEIPAEIVAEALAAALGEGRLVRRRNEAGEDLIYLTVMEVSEDRLAAGLSALAAGAHPCPGLDAAAACRWVEQRLKIELAREQREAVRLALASKLAVITGGPGVGKTTVVSAILQILRAKGLKVVLAAPTGRAAKRMTEATGAEASTIHRLLVFDPATGRFKHDAAKPVAGDVFIIDETSMIDLVLAYQLVRAVPLRAALILVGDVDQLPSVGPGAVLKDVIASGAFPVCRLTEVFRQAAASAIIVNAHRVNHGLLPLYPTGRVERPADSDFYFVRADDPDRGAELVLRLVTGSIPDRFGFDPRGQIQVLTPMQRGSLGARNLNLQLQKALNPEGAAVERFGWTFRVGDRVMQLRNDYDKDVFNGDIGRVSGVQELDQTLEITIDGRPVSYDFGELDEVALAYAVTIHKSQGSEYPCVVVPVHGQHHNMLQRNLLYTAITRGKKLVVLVGTRKALGIAVHRTEARSRITTLRERLAAGAGSRRGGQVGTVPIA